MSVDQIIVCPSLIVLYQSASENWVNCAKALKSLYGDHEFTSSKKKYTNFVDNNPRMLPYRSLIAWDAQENALDA